MQEDSESRVEILANHKKEHFLLHDRLTFACKTHDAVLSSQTAVLRYEFYDLIYVKRFVVFDSHEDGSVLFWDVTVPRVGLLCKLNTAEFFESDEHPTQATADSSEGDSWPPFRKVSLFVLSAVV